MEDREASTLDGETGQDTVSQAIDRLCRALDEKSKTLAGHVERMTQVALERGCSTGEVVRVVELLRTGRLNVSLTNRMVRSLCPRDELAGSIFKKIVVSCGSDTPCRFAIQVHLLKWINHLLAAGHPTSGVEAVYGPLYLLLDYQVLRLQAASILARTTRDHHVTLARIQRLERLNAFLGGDDAISGLLAIYHEREPRKFVAGPVARAKDVYSKTIDPTWRETIEKHLSSTTINPIFISHQRSSALIVQEHAKRPMTRKERVQLLISGNSAQIGRVLWRSVASAHDGLTGSGTDHASKMKMHIALVKELANLGYINAEEDKMEMSDDDGQIHAFSGPSRGSQGMMQDKDGSHFAALVSI